MREYTQLFRNSCIEAVDAFMLLPWDEELIIPSIIFEETIINALPGYLNVYHNLGVEPPVILMISLLKVAGYTMATSRRYIKRREQIIDREMLLMSDILINEFNVNPAKLLKPAFDAVWNAAGWPRSMNYNEAGNWNSR